MTGLDHGSSVSGTDGQARRVALDDPVWAQEPGSYVTDGEGLFRVENGLSESSSGELFLELEDCASLELILFPARALTSLALRSVTPAVA